MIRGAAFAIVAALAAQVHAAGGHHAVDDASLIETGQYELEGWATRESGGGRLVHGALGCRLGPVEVAVATDHARAAGVGSTAHGLQLKWAREFAPGFSAGLSVSGGWLAQARPRYQGTTVSTLWSWTVRENLALHANIGRDFVQGQPDIARAGVSVDWAPLSPQWRAIVERYVEDETQFARGGLRWLASDRLTVDLSRAHALRGPGVSNWTLGATYAFER